MLQADTNTFTIERSSFALMGGRRIWSYSCGECTIWNVILCRCSHSGAPIDHLICAAKFSPDQMQAAQSSGQSSSILPTLRCQTQTGLARLAFAVTCPTVRLIVSELQLSFTANDDDDLMIHVKLGQLPASSDQTNSIQFNSIQFSSFRFDSTQVDPIRSDSSDDLNRLSFRCAPSSFLQLAERKYRILFAN